MFKPKVIGVGGIFFKAKKPSRLRKWYKDHLSFNLNSYGYSFEFRNANNPEKVQYFLWSVFKNDTDYFCPQTKRVYGQFSGGKHRKNGSLLAKNFGQKSSVKSRLTLMGNLYTYLDPKGNAIEL